MSRSYRAFAVLPLMLALGAGTALAQEASPDPGASPAPMASPGAATTTGSPAPGTTAEGTVPVTAIEYEFVGIPASVTAGTAFTLQNGGQELHEFVVVRRNDGTDQPVEELLGMGEAAFDLVTFVGVLFAEPGQMADGTVVVAEPGQYIAVCNIPVGTTSLAELGGPAATADPAAPAAASPMVGASPDAAASPVAAASPGASPGAIQTHAELGMIVEFSVDGATGTDAGASPGVVASPVAGGAGASPAPTT